MRRAASIEEPLSFRIRYPLGKGERAITACDVRTKRLREKMKKASSLFLFPILLALFLGPRAFAFENRECLECHGNRALVQPSESGEIRSLFVHPFLWSEDIHHQKGLRCVDCHPQASPRSHPRGGFVKADCSQCHPEECEAFQSTVHVQKAGLTDKALPKCHDCHGKHGVRPKEDPFSSVHEKRLQETCRPCHPEVVPKGIFDRLALFRVSGHRKEDVSKSFDMKACILCHHEDAVHGQARVYFGMCNDCHKPRTKGAMLGTTHLIPTAGKQSLTFAMKLFNAFWILGVLAAIGAFLVIRYGKGIGLLFRRKDR